MLRRMLRLAASLRPPPLVSPTRSWCRCAAPPRPECRGCTLTCLLVVCAALLRVHSRQSLPLPRLRSVRRLRSTWYDQSRASCPCTQRSPTGARGGAPCCASTRATSRRCGRRGPASHKPLRTGCPCVRHVLGATSVRMPGCPNPDPNPSPNLTLTLTHTTGAAADVAGERGQGVRHRDVPRAHGGEGAPRQAHQGMVGKAWLLSELDYPVTKLVFHYYYPLPSYSIVE